MSRRELSPTLFFDGSPRRPIAAPALRRSVKDELAEVGPRSGNSTTMRLSDQHDYLRRFIIVFPRDAPLGIEKDRERANVQPWLVEVLLIAAPGHWQTTEFATFAD